MGRARSHAYSTQPVIRLSSRHAARTNVLVGRVRAVRMEMLKQLEKRMVSDEAQSEHERFGEQDWELVGGVVEDYLRHRERIESYSAPGGAGRARMGGLPQPSGATPLTSPCDGAKRLQGDDCL